MVRIDGSLSCAGHLPRHRPRTRCRRHHQLHRHAGPSTTPATSLVERYYDPATGQFLTVDPLVDYTGQAYAYAGSDPVNAIDPLGLSFWSAVGNAFSDVARVAGDVQVGSDSATVYCVFGCEEVWPVTTFASAVSGAAATLATCAASYTGKNSTSCEEAAVVYGQSGGQASSPALESIQNLLNGLSEGGIASTGSGGAGPTYVEPGPIPGNHGAVTSLSSFSWMC